MKPSLENGEEEEKGGVRGRNLHMVCNAFMNWVFNNLHYWFNTLNTNYLAHMLY